MLQQLLRGTTGSLTVVLTDSAGEARTPAGAVTVHVTRGDGTDVIAAATAATSGAATGEFTVPVTATLDLFTAVWTDTIDGTEATSQHQVVGGFYFSIGELRSSDPTLADLVRYPDSFLAQVRQETEEEAEWICAVAFVPRYGRAILDGDGTGQAILPVNHPASVRSARIYTTSTTYTALTAGELAELDVDLDGTVTRPDDVWPSGRANIVIEYEHVYRHPAGWTGLPAVVRRAALLRARSRANLNLSGVLEQATSFTSPGDNTTFQLDRASAFRTGIPEVDAAYGSVSLRERGDNGEGGTVSRVPASRTFSYSPQRNSLFHRNR